MPMSIKKHTLIISIALHFLVLATLITWVPLIKPPVKPPSMIIQSYAYDQSPPVQSSPAMESKTEPVKQQPEKTTPIEKPEIADKQTIALSKAQSVRRASQPATNVSAKVTDAIHLVGDKKGIPKPLIILLGKALAKTLKYPKIAADFRLHGTAYVGFMLHPDGSVSEVEVVESSDAGVLDQEAARAVQAISPLKGTSQYVEKTKPMIIGIIFN